MRPDRAAELAAGVPAAVRDQRPGGLSARRVSRHRVVADVVEDEVVAPVARREVLARVVDDVVGADRSDHVHVLRAADTPVTSAPNALAICTANVPTPPDAPLIRTFWPGRTLPSSRRSCRAVVADTPTAAACSNVRLAGFATNWSSLARRVLGEGAGAPAEHLVARAKALDVLADRFDRARDVRPRDRVLRLAQPGGHAHDEGRAGHEDPVADMDRGRVDADQDLVVADLAACSMSRASRTSAEP